MIIPIESFIKGQTRPTLDYPDIYLLNTKTVLAFLHKIGLNNSYDFDTSYCKSEIQRMGPEYLEYLRKYTPEGEKDILEDDDEEALLSKK